MDLGATFSIVITAGVSLSLSEEELAVLLYSAPLLHVPRRASGKSVTRRQPSVHTLSGVLCFLPAHLKLLCAVLSRSVVSDSLRPQKQPTRLLCPWGFSRPEHWSGLPCAAPPGDLPKLGIEPRSPALQADSLPAEPPGKPKNTGVGNLSLLQGIFPT